VRAVGRRWSIRITSVVAAVALTTAVGFRIAQPRVEARAIRRLQAGASQQGWIATVGGARLTPWLTLDLRDVVLRNDSGWRVEAREVGVHPVLSWRGLIGRAAVARLSNTSVHLPAGLGVELRSTTWAIDSSENTLRLELAGPTPPVALSVTTGREIQVGARFVAAPLSDLVTVSRDGCPVARLGTIDGDAQVLRSSTGVIDVRLKGRTRGLAVASLSADGGGCAANPFGTPADVEAEVRATVDPAAGRATVSRLSVRTRGIDASAQAAVTGGTADPHVSLDLDVPRVDLAVVLAAAGLDVPARDLGVASLSWRVEGRLLDPESLTVSQQLTFLPPAKPVPAIQRLKGDFVHRVETAQGTTKEILVSPRSPDFVPLTDVPPLFLRALLLAEDTDFYGHQGIDLRELPGALATNFARGTFVRGASTIPQQLAKNLFLTRRKTVSRKLEEAALALLLDSTLGKSRELEIYLNVIEWGPGIYGLTPAARYYFGREPAQLTPRQMAFLVVLIPGPVKYQRSLATGTPTPFFEGMITTLLGKLLAAGALSEEDYQSALEAPLDLRVPTVLAPWREVEPTRNPEATEHHLAVARERGA
jgi:Transglycosylase